MFGSGKKLAMQQLKLAKQSKLTGWETQVEQKFLLILEKDGEAYPDNSFWCD